MAGLQRVLIAAWGWMEPETIEDMVDAARTRVAELDGVEPHAAYVAACGFSTSRRWARRHRVLEWPPSM